ncbi:putative epsilon-lactone hydrolase [Aspergillus alliaceus]|uniref:putative epsilon-lactone hydrolase n=1 Tax=Petromyces alliaceus TaxID=209559 RepID=UPI0012A6055F|nr:alpha/beta hydrolase fold protein [Aspergillus alliaceus]KAB8229953.1 alpha/beta hydrolase fold protein [Aspergillus alliaceus]
MEHNLNFWDKLDAFLGWFSIVGAIIYATIAGPFRGASGADSYHHHIIQATVKKLQYLFKSYDQIYMGHCLKNGIEPHFISTERGLKGFWIGRPSSAKYIFINFHGGGFAIDATEPYLDFWPKIQNTLVEAGVETAWLHCTYTLTPHATYPTQCCEAVEALRYVLEDVGRSPGEVLLVGDSAGANLCLAVLSHLTHPSTDMPGLAIQGPIKGAILLSPWVSFSHRWPSVELNEHKDIDTREVTARWSLEYLNGRLSNNYIEAVEAPEEWWNDTQVQQTLVLAGADEVLVDPIKIWMTKYRKSNPDTTLVIGEQECHVAPLVWPMFGDPRETQQEHALKHWLLERLT